MYTGEVTKPVTGHHIVAMVYPGRGHVNPMMNFCSLFASEDITVTFVLTEEWLGFLEPLHHNPFIRLRSIPNVVPSERTRAADFLGFINAVYTKMEAPFDRLLDRLEPPASCIIGDTFLPWTTAVGKRRNIPVVSLWTMVPSVFSIYYHYDLLAARGHFPDEIENLSERGEEIIDYLPAVSKMCLVDLPSQLKHALEAVSSATKSQAICFTSFYDLQPHVINALRANLPIPTYCIGPSIPYNSLNVPPSNNHLPYFKWLEAQPKASVLYVSLGSYLRTSKEQIQELALGLKASGFRYLWIDRGETSLSREDCGENGLIVPWCDQLRVLCHFSIAGFLTHCGWNSTLESIFAGVPMISFPLFVDQIYNSKLIVDDWGVGLKLKKILGGEHVVGREEIAESVKRLMDLNGNEGKELRRRAKELQEICQRAIGIGGSTHCDLNAFVRDFVKGQCKTTILKND